MEENYRNFIDDEQASPLLDTARIPEAEELVALIEGKQYHEFRRIVSEIPSADIAELFDDVKGSVRPRFFRLLPTSLFWSVSRLPMERGQLSMPGIFLKK